MLILVLNPFIVFSQQSFDLKQCIKTGLEQNYQIRISKNEQKIADNNLIHVFWSIDTLDWMAQPASDVVKRTLEMMKKSKSLQLKRLV